VRDSSEILTEPPPPAADERLVYGPEPKQFGDLRRPAGDGPWPLAIVLHGGAWKAMYNLIHTGHMCEALRDAGIATFNVEYRAVGDVGGGWPGAGEDVALAVEFAKTLEADRRMVVGHSAGGHLALWAAKRAQLPVLALAAVTDLRESAERVELEGAVARLLDGADVYTDASPIELLPLGVRQILIHGTEDDEVPYEMSRAYVRAAGREAELVALEGAGHFELIDPQAAEFAHTLAAVRALLEI
jgi:acetyl esterase/lipase